MRRDVLLVALLLAWPAASHGQDAPAPTAPASAAPAAPADVFRFSTDAAAMFFVVKADKVEDFELVWGVIRSRLAASSNPDLKALGDTMKVFKISGPPGAPEANYLFLADPASKTLSYSAAPYLMYESGLFERPEAEELFKMLSATIVRINPLPMATIAP